MPGVTTRNLEIWLAELHIGNPVARQEIFKHSQERLKHMVRRQFRMQPDLRMLEETDDILQKALMRLHKALESVPPGTPQEYFGLAAQQIRWVLLDLGHEMGRKKEHESLEYRIFSDKFLFSKPRELSVPPSTLVEWEHFHQCINSLPRLERSLFDLIYYQGLSHEDTATILALSASTLKRHWRNAKILLYEKMNGEYPKEV